MSKEKNNNQSPRPHSSPRQQKLIKSALQYQIQNMLTNKYGRSCMKSLIHMVNIKSLLLFKYLQGDISLFLCISSDFKIPPPPFLQGIMVWSSSNFNLHNLCKEDFSLHLPTYEFDILKCGPPHPWDWFEQTWIYTSI